MLKFLPYELRFQPERSTLVSGDTLNVHDYRGFAPATLNLMYADSAAVSVQY